VWRALTDAREFGAWFGVKLQGGFAAGARVLGQITIPGYEHVTMDITIVRLERTASLAPPPRRRRRLLGQATTLVSSLEEIAGGTRLIVVESGFESIPLARRAKAFEDNEGGWAAQLENIARHVSA
jgi:uncharacterized protein YndB with AHSA1/START domain